MVPGKDINLNANGFIIVQSGSSRMFDPALFISITFTGNIIEPESGTKSELVIN